MKTNEKVSIIIPVHNAIRYCHILFKTLPKTVEVDYEVVIVDNNSKMHVKLYLIWQYLTGNIARLCLLNKNTLFAEGNNIAASASSRDSTHVLLLNSDIEVRNPLWLRQLLDIHQEGATAYGCVEDNPWTRADGYCFLIDRHLYLKYLLNEEFQWWWSVTKLQTTLLQDGFLVQAIKEHDDQIYHFGGKSGKSFKSAKGLNTELDKVIEWFDGNSIKVIESI